VSKFLPHHFLLETLVRQITLVRGGALLTAAALTLSLGAGPASAAESTPTLRPAAAVADAEDRPAARPATGTDLQDASSARASRSAEPAPVVDVTRIKAYSTQLFSADENYIDLDVSLNEGADENAIDNITFNLSVDGKRTGPLDLWYDDEEDVTFVIVPGDVGLGKAKIIGSTINYTAESGLAPTNDTTKSNLFYVRRGIVGEASYAVKGKKKTFYAENIGIFKPSIGTFTSLKTIKLQYKKGSKWKTKKTIKLDVEGNGRYSFTTSTKYRYRFYSAVTTTSGGFVTSATPKI
jgi:hypothetical protein